MPNHIHNVLSVLGTDVPTCKKILKSIQDDEAGGGSIDFNKICPMPESLNMTEGSDTDNSIELYLTMVNPKTPNYGLPKVEQKEFTKMVDQLNATQHFCRYEDNLSEEKVKELLKKGVTLENGKKAIHNLIEYGSTTWYQWCITHWGTKWNAYNYGNEHIDYVVFDTAWNCPLTIIDKLSQMYPEVKFEISWADEDIGYNCGNLIVQNGKVLEDNSPVEGTEDAEEFAGDIWANE